MKIVSRYLRLRQRRRREKTGNEERCEATMRKKGEGKR